MPNAVRAIRGATTVNADDPQQITERVQELIGNLVSLNGLEHEDIISITFTATSDIHSMFPATAARSAGLADVPLFGAQEIDVVGALPFCIRVMAHVNTELGRDNIKHVYLHEARKLRADLVK